MHKIYQRVLRQRLRSSSASAVISLTLSISLSLSVTAFTTEFTMPVVLVFQKIVSSGNVRGPPVFCPMLGSYFLVFRENQQCFVLTPVLLVQLEVTFSFPFVRA